MCLCIGNVYVTIFMNNCVYIMYNHVYIMYLHVRYSISESVFIVTWRLASSCPKKQNKTTSTTTCRKIFILILVAVSQQKHSLLSPISAPSVYGVSFLKMIELVGLFP